MTDELTALLARAAAAFEAMTPDEQSKMARQQRRSYVIAEAALGSDADGAAYIVADKAARAALDVEAVGRVKIARAWLDAEGL